ncbi:hypothetical protein AKJ65_00810 [candidate division MSBL1 archaeon SCGC-AAA259E19]|uniref:Uncharacterized protein n=1 Tax=candidate division MSBL1 archaeon SCGC-AAA259E19 TaxID=1698264 RepID=A0A133UNL1_9EURY|nr:hypothetical protein AKJ65_00810 [candidate division MSBL1 archaeon SCGC-AAA259E19]
MSFVRTKKINGNEYAYRVKSVREDGKVRQKVLKYLGPADQVELGTTEEGWERTEYDTDLPNPEWEEPPHILKWDLGEKTVLVANLPKDQLNPNESEWHYEVSVIEDKEGYISPKELEGKSFDSKEEALDYAKSLKRKYGKGLGTTEEKDTDYVVVARYNI